MKNNEQHCGTCEYFIPRETGVIGAKVGECRRLPALIVIVPGEPGQNDELQTRWPVVQGVPGFYCFEYKKKIRPGDIVEFPVPGSVPGSSALDRLEAAIKNLADQVEEYFRDRRA